MDYREKQLREYAKQVDLLENRQHVTAWETLELLSELHDFKHTQEFLMINKLEAKVDVVLGRLLKKRLDKI